MCGRLKDLEEKSQIFLKGRGQKGNDLGPVAYSLWQKGS